MGESHSPAFYRMILNQDVRDGRIDQDQGMNQDWVRLPFEAAQGSAHPPRMGEWTKIIVNLSLERPQYCRGESHSPALCRIHFFIFTIISNYERFHNLRLWMTILKIINCTDSSFHSEFKTCYMDLWVQRRNPCYPNKILNEKWRICTGRL